MQERETDTHQPSGLHPTSTAELPTDVDERDGVVLIGAAHALLGGVQVMDPHDDTRKCEIAIDPIECWNDDVITFIEKNVHVHPTSTFVGGVTRDRLHESLFHLTVVIPAVER
jgi:hypothetical protein